MFWASGVKGGGSSGGGGGGGGGDGVGVVISSDTAAPTKFICPTRYH